VTQVLAGEYFHSVDDKGRLIFPAKLRDELGEHFVVTRWFDDCLVVFSMEEWENICEKLKNQPMGRSSKLQRYLFAYASFVEPDKQGRILIPANLREKAGITRDVAVIGVMNRAEIWDKERWVEMADSIDASVFDEKMLDLDI
jgi:MraZ protein